MNLSVKTSLLASLFLLSINSFAQIPTDSLKAYFPFDGNTNDMSGSNNHGIPNNAILSPDRFGRPSSTYNFNGVNSSITGAANQELEMTSQLTISAWVNTFSHGQQQIFSIGDNGINTYQYCLAKTYQNGSDRIYFLAHGISTNFEPNGPNYGNDSIPLNEWTMLTTTYDGSDLKLYVNGVLDRTETINDTFNNSSFPNFHIGQRFDGAQSFDGEIDDIVVYNRALNSSEIQQLYNTSAYDMIPTPNYIGPTTVCAGDSVTFDSATINAYTTAYNIPDSAYMGFGWYYGSCGATNVGSSSGFPHASGIIIPDTSGIISVYVDLWIFGDAGTHTGLYGHSSCIQIDFDVHPLPDPNLGADTIVTSGYTLNPGVFDSYLWSNGSTSHSLTVTNSGKYWVQVTTSSGCINSDTVNITIDNTTDIYEVNNEELIIYPNPVTNNLLTVNTSVLQPQIIIFDLSGKSLIRSNSTVIDVSRLEKGTYIMQVNNIREPFVKL
ncbi:MAG: LamG-like jellyroll fold domain-containing protein [Salibacteraceae bacterium]